jgi:hypothetical protein
LANLGTWAPCWECSYSSFAHVLSKTGTKDKAYLYFVGLGEFIVSSLITNISLRVVRSSVPFHCRIIGPYDDHSYPVLKHRIIEQRDNHCFCNAIKYSFFKWEQLTSTAILAVFMGVNR